MFFAIFDFLMCLLWAVLIILFQNELYKGEEPAFTGSVLSRTLQNYYQFGCNFVQQTTKYKQWHSAESIWVMGVVLMTFLEMFHIWREMSQKTELLRYSEICLFLFIIPYSYFSTAFPPLTCFSSSARPSHMEATIFDTSPKVALGFCALILAWVSLKNKA